MHRQRGAPAVQPGRIVDLRNRLLQVGQVARLGQLQVGQPVTGAADQGVHIVGERRVIDRVHPRPDPAEAVVGRQRQLGHHPHVRRLGAHRRAVLTVERDVEDRAQFGLQRQRFAHALFCAAAVVAHRQIERGIALVDQRVAGQQRSGHGGWGRRRARSAQKKGLAAMCRPALAGMRSPVGPPPPRATIRAGA